MQDMWPLYALGSALLWGMGQVVEKRGLDRVAPSTFLYVRALTDIAVWAPLAVVAGFRTGLPWLVLAAAVCQALGNVAGIEGLRRGPASLAGVVGSAYPVVTVILAVVVLREPMRPLEALAIAGLIGGTLLTSSGDGRRLARTGAAAGTAPGATLGVGPRATRGVGLTAARALPWQAFSVVALVLWGTVELMSKVCLPTTPFQVLLSAYAASQLVVTAVYSAWARRLAARAGAATSPAVAPAADPITPSTAAPVIPATATPVTPSRRPAGQRLLTSLGSALAVGVMYTGGYWPYYLALSSGPLRLASPLMAGYPVMTLIGARLFLRERLAPRQIAAVGLVLASSALARHRTDLDVWAKEEFKYDPRNPAASYGTVMEELFFEPAERQLELESLCDGRFPGFGYAALATLVAREGGHFNVILTTNFDDLMADALYLFTAARPLVIQHESLASYIRPTRTRPLVVKLHGDHRLAPHNTPDETSRLKEDIERQVHAVLYDRGLIFVGYGGGDEGIRKMLKALPPEALLWGVFWASDREPAGPMREWLASRKATWVCQGDFDELMLLIRDAFDLPHPDRKRFDAVFEGYFNTYKKLTAPIASRPDTGPDTRALKEAVKRTDQAFTDWWAVQIAADRVEASDPERADAIYQEGLRQFPGCVPLLVNCALFLQNIRKDCDRAEELYRRAIDADPSDGISLGNYAVFLANIRKDCDRSEEFFRRAIDADPNHANNLGNYAGFLLALGRPEGLAALASVLALPALQERPSLAAECWFYAFVHRPEGERPEALRKLKGILTGGVRSPGWDLSRHVQRARQDGHPDADWLERLAAVISDGADIAVLDEWPAWRKA
jgi:drug/metabolite transporter (DMT)-like permease/tetratricopeptide (TPR) repeat protein